MGINKKKMQKFKKQKSLFSLFYYRLIMKGNEYFPYGVNVFRLNNNKIMHANLFCQK